MSVPTALRIIGTGIAAPRQEVSHEELDRRLGLPAGSTLRATGVRSRRLSTTETAAELAAEAARRAVSAAGLEWSEIDCLVSTSATMDQALPYNAAMIHAELGLPAQRTTTFDLGASCMSFLVALDVVSHLVQAGRFRYVVLVAADIAAFTADFSQLAENGIFGDGAAACVVRRSGPGEDSRLLAAASVTLSEGIDFCRIRSGGSRFHRRVPGSNSEAAFEMNGKAVFALVARELPAFVADLLAQAGLQLADIDLVVPHQASHLALAHVRKRLRIDPARYVDIFAEHGNQVGASLPTALHHGLQRANVARGSKILLLGSGAGVTLGGAVLIY